MEIIRTEFGCKLINGKKKFEIDNNDYQKLREFLHQEEWRSMVENAMDDLENCFEFDEMTEDDRNEFIDECMSEIKYREECNEEVTYELIKDVVNEIGDNCAIWRD